MNYHMDYLKSRKAMEMETIVKMIAVMLALLALMMIIGKILSAVR